ncbi:MAG: asparagine synthase (glutamine-hydrolyzing) [Candidatus Eisenbacteria bacterium]|nr:asparagine synthase (glutamine-hydrolyzing) [Candidatus Eisenbacteria bacterium]
MCGIVGTFNYSDRPVDETEFLASAMHALRHRGPDESGTFLDGRVALGHTRLSIIDLETGTQPIRNEDGTIAVALNGEIYNFRELKDSLEKKGHTFKTHSDTETIVHLYEEKGKRFVHDLRGMFAIALWDAKKQELLLVRDRIGKKPLYYSNAGNELVFASEIKAILRHGRVEKEMDLTALDNYLSWGYVPGPSTIFLHVKKMMPGTMGTVSRNGIAIEKYWSPAAGCCSAGCGDDVQAISGGSHAGSGAASEGSMVDELGGLLSESVRLRLVSDVPLGAFLSGGLDSSMVVSLMCRESTDPVVTFSVGFEDPQYNELSFARKVSSFLRTEHHELIVPSKNFDELLSKAVWHFDEPNSDGAAVPTFLVSEFARKHVKVVLTGEGADELFAGYGRYRKVKSVHNFRKIPLSVRKALLKASYRVPDVRGLRAFIEGSLRDGYNGEKPVFSGEDKCKLLEPDLAAEIVLRNRESPGKRDEVSYDSLDPLAQAILLDIENELPFRLLMKVDKMTMASSLEARAPFLDHKVVEYALSIPSRFKLRHGQPKVILKKVAKSLLPDEILQRPKHGFFLPEPHLLRTTLKSFLEELTLGNGRFESFRKEYVDRLLREHISGEKNNHKKLWSLLTFEIWRRHFGN